jgi:hypothetical protein
MPLYRSQRMMAEQKLFHIVALLMILLTTTTEEQRERSNKALKLNCGTDYEPRLLAASSKKPTIRIKRLSFSDNNPLNTKEYILR